jgi:hypothetical protein
VSAPGGGTDNRPVERPIVFRVGIYIGAVGGGGRLLISPGAIELEVGRATRLLSRSANVLHRERVVTLVRARLMPPWFDTALLLAGDGGSAVAVTSILRRRALRLALARAGFQVNEVVTWFSLRGLGATSIADHPGSRSADTRRALLAATVVAGAGAVLLVHEHVALVVLIAIAVAATCVALWRNPS